MTTGRKRGRPKGTGINDRPTLIRIAQILAADPAKKRTTAIKEIGITDPSVVRRLRDKYQEHEQSLLAEVTAAAAPAKGKRKAAAPTEKTDKKGKTAPAAASAGAARPQTASREEPIIALAQPQASAAASQPAADPLAAIFDGLSIETLVSQFVGHVLGLNTDELKDSPITAMIRQQAQLVDLILPLLQSQLGVVEKVIKAA